MSDVTNTPAQNGRNTDAIQTAVFIQKGEL